MPFPHGGGIIELTSTGDTVTITNPEGPTTNLEVEGGGGGITQLTGDISAGPGSGSQAAEIAAIQGINLAITDLTSGDVLEYDGTNWVNTPGGGGGGIASLSGAGVTESPGILDQAGGLNLQDYENDGVELITVSVVNLSGQVGASVSAGSPGAIASITASGSGIVGVASAPGVPYIIPNDTPTIPLTVVEGVNDTFVMTPIGTGTPETFTIAPGTYATLNDLVNAVNAATGTDSDTFVDNYQATAFSTDMYLEDFSGSNESGTTISFGPTDVAADLGFSDNPNTAAASPGDQLNFFSSTGAVQQTVAGALSTVVDPAAKAVLTSLIAALGASAGYGLVIDGTT